MSSKPGYSARSQQRINAERQIAKRREKEYNHQQTWEGRTRYYKTFGTANSKHEEWTSPRYYHNQNEMITETKRELEKSEQLEKRRDKLRKLLTEDENSHQIELTVKNRDKLLSNRRKLEDIPTELLKDLNLGIQLEEDERRRHEAEIGLYHQWRKNNPIVRQYERSIQNREMKLSWLDQQIEKRMEKEKEEAECKRMLAERDKRLREMQQEEEMREKQEAEKRDRLREDLERQMAEITEKQKLSEQLKKEEEEKTKKQADLLDLEQMRKEEERRRAQYECALYNIRHYKVRLKQKAQEMEENLKREKELLQKLLQSQIAEEIQQEEKRQLWKRAVDEFSCLLCQQQDLEKRRQNYLDFVFESEAKVMYEKQNEIWATESMAREKLFKDILDTVRSQIADKIRTNRQKQEKVLKEREESIKLIEEYNEELRKSKKVGERAKEVRKRELDKQVKEKQEMRRKLKSFEQRNIDLQIENARKEEDRLRREILDLQAKQDKVIKRSPRTGIWF